jgi:hypothetical protein
VCSSDLITDKDLSVVSDLLDTLEAKEWEGKFGLGCVQWTGDRTKTLVQIYQDVVGSGVSTITLAQATKAEGLMISRELKQEPYKTDCCEKWENQNAGNLDSTAAAKSAAEILCTWYERPDKDLAKMPTRISAAEEIYNIMMKND